MKHLSKFVFTPGRSLWQTIKNFIVLPARIFFPYFQYWGKNLPVMYWIKILYYSSCRATVQTQKSLQRMQLYKRIIILCDLVFLEKRKKSTVPDCVSWKRSGSNAMLFFALQRRCSKTLKMLLLLSKTHLSSRCSDPCQVLLHQASNANKRFKIIAKKDLFLFRSFTIQNGSQRH